LCAIEDKLALLRVVENNNLYQEKATSDKARPDRQHTYAVAESWQNDMTDGDGTPPVTSQRRNADRSSIKPVVGYDLQGKTARTPHLVTGRLNLVGGSHKKCRCVGDQMINRPRCPSTASGAPDRKEKKKKKKKNYAPGV